MFFSTWLSRAGSDLNNAIDESVHGRRISLTAFRDSTACPHNFSYHLKGESNDCFIIHPTYLHLHENMLTGLDVSHVPVSMTDLILGSFAGRYSQTCIKRSLTKILEIISLKAGFH